MMEVRNKTARPSAESLQSWVREVLQAYGMADESAMSTAKYMVLADLRGVSSHGVALLERDLAWFDSGLNLTPDITVHQTKPGSAIVDADNGLGFRPAEVAMDWAVQAARVNGIGMAVVRNTNHFGSAAGYALRAVQQNCVGLVTTNGPPVMAPYGGSRPTICNNPIAIGVSEDPPFVFDGALSTVARGRIRLAARSDTAIPDTWAVDANGVPTTDPHAALLGALQPLAGYKGFGLALAMEVLAGILPQARFGLGVPDSTLRDEMTPLGHGHFLLAIDIESLMPLKLYRLAVGSLLGQVRTSAPAGGEDAVLSPGEAEARTKAQNMVDGIGLPAPVLASLARIAVRVGVPLPRDMLTPEP